LALLKSLAKGFLVGTGLVIVLNIAALMVGGDAWLGIIYLLILLLPTVSLTYLKFKGNQTKMAIDESAKWRNMLFSLQGVALAFWMFDILTTYYAIDVARWSVELNPLGWPLGILGALAYYAPTLVFSYVLLFKLKGQVCLYVVCALTVLTLMMGSMNLAAGINSFGVFVATAHLASEVRFGLLALVASLDLAVPLALRSMISQPKNSLKIRLLKN
jgi:hypothetical protein